MTGFGEARRQDGSLAVAVEVRTINSRFFKLSLRASEGYAVLEPQIESYIRGRIKRGTVQVQLRVDHAQSGEDYRINQDVLNNYRRQLASLYNEWHVSETVPVDAMLSLPGVVEDTTAQRKDVSRVWPLVEAALAEAIDGLDKMRAEEGQALAADLQTNCRTIAEDLDRIQSRVPQVSDEYTVRMTERVNRTLERYDLTLNPADVVRELALLAERSDVSEEIVRLRSHLEQFGLIMAEAESSGRKLDFLTQEMLREANTIGSKSVDVSISREVIDIKTAIERIREQVQNVE
jgi:uncharacterized protein (TIGR00255 family)